MQPVPGGTYPDTRLFISTLNYINNGGWFANSYPNPIYFDPTTSKVIADGVSLDIGDVFLKTVVITKLQQIKQFGTVFGS